MLMLERCRLSPCFSLHQLCEKGGSKCDLVVLVLHRNAPYYCKTVVGGFSTCSNE